MLERDAYEDGWQVRMQTSGAARLIRLVPAAFLCVWLCFWAVGMFFAGGMLLAGLRELLAPGIDLSWLPRMRNAVPPQAGFVLVFLAVWLTFWTMGGVFALTSLAELLFGEPFVRWNAEGVEQVTQVGPIARRRRLAWAQVRDISELKLGGVTVSGGRKPLMLGPLTDADDRAQLIGWLQEARRQAPDPSTLMTVIG